MIGRLRSLRRSPWRFAFLGLALLALGLTLQAIGLALRLSGRG